MAIRLLIWFDNMRCSLYLTGRMTDRALVYVLYHVKLLKFGARDKEMDREKERERGGVLPLVSIVFCRVFYCESPQIQQQSIVVLNTERGHTDRLTHTDLTYQQRTAYKHTHRNPDRY